MNDNATSLALVALLGTVITGLFKLSRDNTKAIENNTKALERVASATEKGATEAEARNGHLAEISVRAHKETIKAVKSIPTTMKDIADHQAQAIIKAVKIDKQSVKEQTIEHQTVKG